MSHLHYVVNLDKQEYLDPTKMGDQTDLTPIVGETGGVMTALVILLAVSNGRGGGDLNCNDKTVSDLVGSWGGNHITITDELPAGFRDLSAQARALVASDGYIIFTPADETETAWTRRDTLANN